MKIKKLLEKKDFKIIRTNKEIIYKLNSKKVSQDEFKKYLIQKFLEATETKISLIDLSKETKDELKQIVKKFLQISSEMKLSEFICKSLVILEDELIYGHKMYQDVINDFCSGENNVYKKKTQVDNLLNKIYGKPFKLLIGHIYHNHDKNISEISLNSRSHLNKTIKSFENNVINFKNDFDFNIEDNQLKILKSDFKDIELPKYNLKNKQIRNINDLRKIDKDKKILYLYLLILKKVKYNIKECTINSKFNDSSKEGEKFHNIKKKNEKFYNSIKKDLMFYFVNKCNFTQKDNIDTIIDDVNKIINNKIEVFKTRKKSQNTFIHPAEKFLKSLEEVTDDNIIISHSIHKFYRNMATLVGCSIINYKLQMQDEFKKLKGKNAKEYKWVSYDMYDFSDSDFETCLLKRSNVLNMNIPLLNELNLDNVENTKIAVFFALQNFRNSIMHLRNLNNSNFYDHNSKILSEYETIASELKELNIKNLDFALILEDLYNKLMINKNKVIENKFKNRKIPVKNIKYYEGINFSLSYNKIFKKLLNITDTENNYSKNIQMKNNWKFLSEFKNDELNENVDSKKFILKWIYENDFQIWLKDDLKEHFNVAEFKNWYKNLVSKPKSKLSYPDFIEKYQNIENLYFESNLYLSSVKNDDKDKMKQNLEKKQAFVENVWIFIFDCYLNSEQSELVQKLNNANFINENMIYSICERKNSMSAHWFLFSCINLNKYELSKMLKYVQNYYNRTFKNKNKIECCKYIEDVSFLLNEDEILNIIKNIKLLIINQDNLEKFKIENLNELNESETRLISVLDNIDNYQNKNVVKNSTHKNMVQLLNYYQSGLYKKEFEVIFNNNKEFELLKDIDADDTKKTNLKIAQIKRFNNRQTLVNIFNLIKEIKYMYINWVMHREFYYQNYISLKLNNSNINSKLRKLKKKKTEEEFNECKEKIINEIGLFKSNTSNYFMINETKNNIKNYCDTLKKFINNLNYPSQEQDIKEFYIAKYESGIKNYDRIKFKDLIEKTEKALFVNSELTASLSPILHLNHVIKKYPRDEVFALMISTINKIRESLDYKRNLKNQITPSLERLFDKNHLNIYFEFDNHKIQEIKIKAKKVTLNEFNSNKKFEHNLIHEQELKLYKLLLQLD